MLSAITSPTNSTNNTNINLTIPSAFQSNLPNNNFPLNLTNNTTNTLTTMTTTEMNVPNINSTALTTSQPTTSPSIAESLLQYQPDFGNAGLFLLVKNKQWLLAQYSPNLPKYSCKFLESNVRLLNFDIRKQMQVW
jgi:hypothetical protein